MEGSRTRVLGRAPVDPLVERRAFAKVEANLFGPSSRPVVLHRYALVRRVATGGSGTVFAAYDPELDRKVAIKVLHTERDSDEGEVARARLIREARAAARLTHPNVIRVYDVGTFDPALLSPIDDDDDVGDAAEGVFVAMELVEGTDLRRWIQRMPRSWREVLEVFRAAGRGLVAAHDAGLVHRDFKPGNVLIADDGRVLVADFGLARGAAARDHGLHDDDSQPVDRSERPTTSADDGRVTRTGTVMGTPVYMAPEQHRGEDADARADQFAFCASLYRCLFGEMPFEGSRLATLERAKLDGRVRPFPLDTPVPRRIRNAVMRGLRARPEERFDSMGELLAQLQWEPWLRRHRAVLIAASMVGVGGVGAAVGGWHAAPEAACADVGDPAAAVWNDDRRDAIRRSFVSTVVPYAADAAALTAEGVDAWTRSWVSARRAACEATHVRAVQSQGALDLRLACLDVQLHRLSATLEVLDDADPVVVERSARLVAELPAPGACGEPRVLEPVVEAPPSELRETVDALRRELERVRVLISAGRHDDADREAQRLLAASEATGHAPIVAEALLVSGAAAGQAGRLQEAFDRVFAAHLVADRIGDDHFRVETISGLVNLQTRAQQFDRADREVQRARAVLARLGEASRIESDLEQNISSLRFAQGRFEESLSHAERALELQRRIAEDETPRLATLMGNVGSAQWSLTRYDEAIATLRQACAITERVLPARHPRRATCLSNLGNAYFDAGRYDEALAVHREALSIREALRPPDPHVADSVNNVGNVLLARGELEQALKHYERALAIKTRSLPADDLRLVTTLANLAEVLNNLDRHEEALPHAERAEHIERRTLGDDAVGLGYALTQQGRSLFALGRLEEAEAALREALALREASADEVPAVELAMTRLVLAAVLDETSPGEAEALRRSVEAMPRDGRWDIEALEQWLERRKP